MHMTKKSIILCLVGIFLSFVLNAQSVSGTHQAADSLIVQDALSDGGSPSQMHLCFKEIPIDGSLDQFTRALRQKGYRSINSASGISYLEGRFAGRENCRVTVYSESGIVWRVIVTLPGQETWTSMKKEYKLFKKSYGSKYLVQPKSIELFPSYLPEGTGREHNAFREETAVYQSVFTMANGSITIAIAPVSDGRGKFCLKIEYKDDVNSYLKTTAFMNDL